MDQPTKSKHESGAVAKDADLQPLLPDGTRRRILTGDRPTGRLHLGHYVGSLRNRVRLQNTYDTFILIADVQALTTHFDRPEMVRESVLQVALDYLAVGLDPWNGKDADGKACPDDGSKCKFVVQSMVPQIAELTVLYGLLVPVRSLIDNPTTKAEAEQYGYGSAQRNESHIAQYDKSVYEHLLVRIPIDFGEVGEIDEAALDEAIDEVEKSTDIAIRDDIEKYKKETSDHWPRALYMKNVASRRAMRDVLIKLKRSRGFNAMPYGFLGYPVSQAADITFVGAHLVPVGPDQVPLIELCREVVHRVNSAYGEGRAAVPGRQDETQMAGTEARPPELLTEPQALLGTTELIRGLDGSIKMGKSLGNAVYLSDTPEQIWAQLKGAVTDPQRVRRNDPGRPEVCNVFAWHKVFNAEAEPSIAAGAPEIISVEETAEACRTAAIGCVDCKKNLAAKLEALLTPMRARRAYWEARPDEVIDILRLGTLRAREEGEKTLSRVKAAMHIDHFPL